MVRAPAHLMRESDRTPRPRPVSPAGRGFCCVFFYVLVILRSTLARVSKDGPQAGTIILRDSPQVRLAPQDDDNANPVSWKNPPPRGWRRGFGSEASGDF